MQSAIAERSASRGRSRSESDLISLATPVIETILRLKAGLLTPSKELRRTIDEYLKQAEQRGEKRAYPAAQLQAMKFALAAFVDETVLTADFPLREEWEKYPLQLEYFGEHLAGVKFFERLEEMLKDTEKQAELIELYYLCLLLGYKGKYQIYYEDQLKNLIDKLAEHLRRVGRLRLSLLSPHWKATDQPAPPSAEGFPLWAKISLAVAIGLVIVIYSILSLWLRSDLNAALQQLLR
jgi:type VI secretion system protein ImpK